MTEREEVGEREMEVGKGEMVARRDHAEAVLHVERHNGQTGPVTNPCYLITPINTNNNSNSKAKNKSQSIVEVCRMAFAPTIL